MTVLFDPEELRRLEQRLTTRLEELASPARPVVADRVRASIATVQQRHGLQAWVIAHRPDIAFRPAILGAFVVALAVATGIGIGASGLLSPRPTASNRAAPTLSLSQPSATPVPTPEQTQSPSPTLVTSTPTPLPVSTAYATWQSVGMPDPSPQTFSGEWPYAVAEFRGQLIAVGAINGSCCTGNFSTDSRAVVWRSADARTWELEPNRSVFALGNMDALATDGHLLVSGGSLMLNSKDHPGELAPIGATWTSSDGVTWARHTGMPTFYGVAWNSGRFYGIAEDPAAGSSSVWASVDGVSWSLVRRFQGDFLPIIRSTPLGLVAIGSAGEPNTANAPTWFSKDGTTWTRYLAGSGFIALGDVAGNGSVLVAIGAVQDAGSDVSRPAFWVGYREWSRTAMIYEEPAPLLERVVWTGTSFVALGGDANGMQSFTSADGVQWRESPPSRRPGVVLGEVTDAIALSDGRLLVIGVGEGRDGHHGVPLAWIVSP